MGIVDLLGDFESPREHTYGKPHIADDGMRRINRVLHDRYGKVLPPGFAPLLETQRGKVTGRIERLMREFYDVKLSVLAKQEVGNLVEQYAVKGSSYIFDFTYDVLTWASGSFGNNSSCWRTSYAASVPMFKIGTGYGPGFTLRTFSPLLGGDWYSGMKGMGRCWIMPYADGRIVMFNPYGERMPVFTSILMSVLQEGAYSTKEVKVRNISDAIYMNNGKGTAVYPFGEKQKIGLILDMPKHYTRDCESCGDKFGVLDKGSRKLCEKCSGRCAVTQSVVSVRNLVEVHDVNVSWSRKSYYVEHGFVGKKIQEKLWFCHECLKWRGDLDTC